MGAVYGRSLWAPFTGAVPGRNRLAVETLSFSRLRSTDRESPHAALSDVLQYDVRVIFFKCCPGMFGPSVAGDV